MASKNDARRLKKKAEKARKRNTIAKIKNTSRLYKSSMIQSFGQYHKSATQDVLNTIGQCENSIFMFHRLLQFVTTIEMRKPSYHTEILNQDITRVKEDVTDKLNDLIQTRNTLKEKAHALKDDHTPTVLMDIMQTMLTVLPAIEMSATACGKIATDLVDIVKMSDTLYAEAKVSDDSLTPLLTEEEKEILGLHTALNQTVQEPTNLVSEITSTENIPTDLVQEYLDNHSSEEGEDMKESSELILPEEPVVTELSNPTE